MSTPESLWTALRRRAVTRAEMFDGRKGHAADARLLRDLVAAVDDARLLSQTMTAEQS